MSVFGNTLQLCSLGRTKVTAHIVDSPDAMRPHNGFQRVLNELKIEHPYPEFIGGNHKLHVTARKYIYFMSNIERIAPAGYLIEVIKMKRLIRIWFDLSGPVV